MPRKRKGQSKAAEPLSTGNPSAHRHRHSKTAIVEKERKMVPPDEEDYTSTEEPAAPSETAAATGDITVELEIEILNDLVRINAGNMSPTLVAKWCARHGQFFEDPKKTAAAVAAVGAYPIPRTPVEGGPEQPPGSVPGEGGVGAQTQQEQS